MPDPTMDAADPNAWRRDWAGVAKGPGMAPASDTWTGANAWDMARGAGRGLAAGTAGLPQQLQSLLEEAHPVAAAAARAIRGNPQFPSSDERLKDPSFLPFESTNPAAAVSGQDAGQFAGDSGLGLNAAGMARRGVNALARAARPAAEALHSALGLDTFAAPSGAHMWPPSDVWGLRHEVPLQPVTGTAAANVLRGGENQKAMDLLKQLSDANKLGGARMGAVKALREQAIGELTGGAPMDQTVSRSGLGALLQQPRSLSRVITRQDLTSPEFQEHHGWQGERVNDEARDEWARDRALENMGEDFYNRDYIDWNDVHNDTARDVDDYLGSSYVSNQRNLSNAKQYDSYLDAIMEKNGVERTSPAETARQTEMFHDQNRTRANLTEADVQERNRATEIEHANRREMFRLMLNDDKENAADVAKRLGYNIEGPEFDQLHDNLASYGNLRNFLKNEHSYGDFDQEPLSEAHRDSHEESARDYFEENNYDEYYNQALNEYNERHGFGEHATEPYSYGDMQRLFGVHDPDQYTQQNVFSYGPTGLTLGQSGRYTPNIQLTNVAQEAEKARLKMEADPRNREKEQWHQYLSAVAEGRAPPDNMASHFPEFTPEDLRSNYLGHFRGSMLGPNATSPGAFALEEMQADPAQTFSKMGAAKQVPGTLQDWVNQVGGAALHHAAKHGATSFWVPEAKAIERLRGAKDYGWLYDKAAQSEMLQPWAKHFGTAMQEGQIPDTGWGEGPVQGRGIELTPEMREEILKKGIPYASGGAFRMMQGIRSAPAAPTINDRSIAHIRRVPGQVKPLMYAEGGEVDAEHEAHMKYIQDVINALP